MDQYTLFRHTLMRDPISGSAEIARRRERLLRVHYDLRQARQSRVRERVRRVWDALAAFHRTGSDEWKRRMEAPDTGEAVR
jgi:hypothetical protein